MNRILHQERIITLISLFLFATGIIVSAESNDSTGQLNFENDPDVTIMKNRQWLKQLWERANINADLISDTEKLVTAKWIEKDYLFLRITDDPLNGRDYQYIVFRDEEGKRRYLGHINITFQKRSVPRTTLVTLNGDDLLVVRSLAMSGTGCALYVDTWWHLGREELEKVLRVPVKGHVIGWGPSFERRFTSGVGLVTKKGNPAGVMYRYIARYWPKDVSTSEESTMETTSNGYWLWDPEELTFRMSEKLSTASREKIDGIYDDDDDGFVEHNLAVLKDLELNTETRKWFKQLIDGCEQNDNRKALKEILRNSNGG